MILAKKMRNRILLEYLLLLDRGGRRNTPELSDRARDSTRFCWKPWLTVKGEEYKVVHKSYSVFANFVYLPVRIFTVLFTRISGNCFQPEFERSIIRSEDNSSASNSTLILQLYTRAFQRSPFPASSIVTQIKLPPAHCRLHSQSVEPA